MLLEHFLLLLSVYFNFPGPGHLAFLISFFFLFFWSLRSHSALSNLILLSKLFYFQKFIARVSIEKETFRFKTKAKGKSDYKIIIFLHFIALFKSKHLNMFFCKVTAKLTF